MARNYIFAPGEYYHLYARGFEKSTVFRHADDYRRFVEGLYLFNSSKPQVVREIRLSLSKGLTSGASIYDVERGDTVVDIGAYCLMPNHFHILTREKDAGGISKFMQKLMTSYTMYFNKKYERTGALFSSSFKARHVTDDNHLKYLFAYIHLNPTDIQDVANNLEKYTHSSYPDYIGGYRPQRAILNGSAFPDYFEGAMKEEVDEWLRQSEV